MVEGKVAALVNEWKQDASLGLSAEQEEKLQSLLVEVTTKARARRDGAKKVIEGLAVSVQAKDGAATEELLKKLREGLRQVGEGREIFLNVFDEILQPIQRAAIVLSLVKRAKDSGKPVEQLVDDLIIQTGSAD